MTVYYTYGARNINTLVSEDASITLEWNITAHDDSSELLMFKVKDKHQH